MVSLLLRINFPFTDCRRQLIWHGIDYQIIQVWGLIIILRGGEDAMLLGLFLGDAGDDAGG